MNIRISATRTIEDPRLSAALNQPHRRHLQDPLDPKAECPLGRMRLMGMISEAEYQAGLKWSRIYHLWLSSIGAPNPFPSAIDIDAPANKMYQEPLQIPCELEDERAASIAKSMRLGEEKLKKLGTRVFHAVNAIAVYEEPEELGDFEFTAKAAKRGLAALAEVF